jgi:integrase
MIRRGRMWYWRPEINGRKRWIALSTNREEAWARARQLNRDLEAGDTPQPNRSVKSAVEEWLEVDVPTRRNAAGQRLTRSRAEMYLVAFMGHMALHKVRGNHLREYRLWLDRQPNTRKSSRRLSSQSVVHILSDARRFFSWCEESGYISRSPVPKRLLPKVQERPPVPFSDEEVARLKPLTGWLGFIVRLGLETGLRWGEMVRARVEDIDFSERILTVHHTKSGRMRRLKLSPEIVEEIRSNGCISTILPYSWGANRSVTRAIRSKSKIADFRFHRLRYTFACRFLAATRDLVALQQALGHSSIQTTQRYARLLDEAVHAQMERYHEVARAVAAAQSGENVAAVSP